MGTNTFRRIVFPVASCLGVLVLFLRPSASAQQTEPAAAGASAPQGANASEPEVLTRGPIHEAFAEPTTRDPSPGPAVAKQPPAAIEEVPPDLKPAGDNVMWIPGYWAWDEDREDYLWVSGVWRNAPPDRRWIPGYWNKTDGEHQRVSGFWTEQDASEVEYVDTPPASVEEGPSSDAPSEDHFWVPGSWLNSDSGYRWRPGYWNAYRDDWIWVPSQYVWTPLGCVYVSGYWDYRLPLRGHLYAPIYYRDPIYSYPGYYYQPNCLIDLAFVNLHLFVHPFHHHYYFGDYHGFGYARRGYYPHHHYHRFRHGYDPLYTHYRQHHRRRGIDYDGRVDGWHRHFERHQEHRPHRTLEEQENFAQRHRGRSDSHRQMLGRRLSDVANQPGAEGRLVAVGTDEQQAVHREATAMRGLGQPRREIDLGTADPGTNASAPAGSEINRPARRGKFSLPRDVAQARRGRRPTQLRSLPPETPDQGPPNQGPSLADRAQLSRGTNDGAAQTPSAPADGSGRARQTARMLSEQARQRQAGARVDSPNPVPDQTLTAPDVTPRQRGRSGDVATDQPQGPQRPLGDRSRATIDAPRSDRPAVGPPSPPSRSLATPSPPTRTESTPPTRRFGGKNLQQRRGAYESARQAQSQPNQPRSGPSIGTPAGPRAAEPSMRMNRPPAGRSAPNVVRSSPSVPNRVSRPPAARSAPSMARPSRSMSRPAPSVSRPAPSMSRPAPSASRMPRGGSSKLRTYSSGGPRNRAPAGRRGR